MRIEKQEVSAESTVPANQSFQQNQWFP